MSRDFDAYDLATARNTVAAQDAEIAKLDAEITAKNGRIRLLEEALSRLTALDPRTRHYIDGYCEHCGSGFDHNSDCPWVAARTLLSTVLEKS